MKARIILPMLLLAAAPMLAQVSIGIHVGGHRHYPPPPPPPVYVYRPPCPGPGYVWIAGYWHRVGPRYVWRRGYWVAPRHKHWKRHHHRPPVKHYRHKDRGRRR